MSIIPSKSGLTIGPCCLMLWLVATVPSCAADKSGEVEDPIDPNRSGWTFSLGGGVGVRPVYEGSDKIRASFMPFAQISYRKFLLINPRGITVTAYQNRSFRFGVSVQMAGGRKESQSTDLKGLGDIGTGVRTDAFASYL